eukprot:47113-Eustigmatos_ZCMA.PRE.1
MSVANEIHPSSAAEFCSRVLMFTWMIGSSEPPQVSPPGTSQSQEHGSPAAQAVVQGIVPRPSFRGWLLSLSPCGGVDGVLGERND